MPVYSANLWLFLLRFLLRERCVTQKDRPFSRMVKSEAINGSSASKFDWVEPRNFPNFDREEKDFHVARKIRGKEVESFEGSSLPD